jgi:hypothetical protein
MLISHFIISFLFCLLVYHYSPKNNNNNNNNNNKNNHGVASRFGLGFASLRERAQEIGSNVASSVNDMNAKMAEAAKKAASSTPNNSMHGGRDIMATATTTPSPTRTSTTTTTTTATSTATATPESSTVPTPGGGGERLASASKEELVEILQKMNKKVKALSALRIQLQEKLQTTEQERDQLKALVINCSVMTKRPTPMERSEIMAASIQQLSEVYKEMEALDQQEIQHLKQALYEAPPPTKSNTSDFDFAVKEKQLQQEHQRAMTELTETLKRQHQEDLLKMNATILQLQQQQQQQPQSGSSESSEKVPSTPAGEGSTEVDNLKSQHAAEIEKLKKAAALQLANFKKKVATAREAELEKVKRETREDVLQELQKHNRTVGEEKSTKDNDPAAKIAVEEQQKHQQNLQSLREELQKKCEEKCKYIRDETTKILQQEHQARLEQLQAQTAQAVQQARQEAQEQTTKLKAEITLKDKTHEEEKQNILQEAAQNLQLLRKEMQEKTTKAMSEATSLQEQVHARIEEIQQRHLAEIISKEEAWRKRTADEIEQIKRSYDEKVQQEQVAVEESQSQKLQECVNNLRAQLTDEFEKEKVRLQQMSDAVLTEERTRCTDKLETLQSEFETYRQRAANEHKTELAQAIEQAKMDLQRKHSEDVDKLKQEQQTGQFDEVQALRQKFAAQAKKFQETAMQKRKEAVEEAKKQVELAVRQEWSAKWAELETKFDQQKQSYESSLAQIKEELAVVEKNSQESLMKLNAAQDEMEALQHSKQDDLNSAERRYQELLAIEKRKMDGAKSADLQRLQDDWNAEKTKEIQDAVSLVVAAKDEHISKITIEHESFVLQLKKDADRLVAQEMERAKTEAAKGWEQRFQDAISSENTRIQLLEDKLSRCENELSASLQKEKELVGEVAKFESKLSALNEEKNAILASMEDGENRSSQNAIEESLSKQRGSYEQILADQKAIHDEELSSLRQTVESLSGYQIKFQELEQVLSCSQEESQALVSQLRSNVAQLEEQRDSLQNDLLTTKANLDETAAISVEKSKELETVNLALSADKLRLQEQLQTHAMERNIEKRKSEEVVLALQSQLEQVDKTLSLSREAHERFVNESKETAEMSKTVQAVELEKLQVALNEKDKELASMKSEHEAQLSALSEKQSTLQMEHAELENRLKLMIKNQRSESSKQGEALQTLKLDLDRRHSEEVANLRQQYNAEVERLKESLRSKDHETEAKIKIEIDSQAEKHVQEVEELRKRMADHVDKMKEQLKIKLQEEREKSKFAAEEAETKDKKREEQLSKLASQLKQLNDAIKKERDDKLALHRSIKEQKATEHKLTMELEVAKKTLEEALTDSESTAQSLLAEQDSLRMKAETMEAEAKKIQADRNQQANKVEELSGKLEALTQNLNALAEDLKQKDALLIEAEKQKTKLFASENEVAELRQDINKLKLELTKNAQVANRLQAEKEATERNHGQRTAMLGMLESQLADVNEKNSDANAKLEAALYDLSQKDEMIKAAEEKLRETQSALQKAHQEKKAAAESLSHAQKGAAKKTAMQVESLHRELQQLQQSSARKSAAAQKMIQEKEAECLALRSANFKLQQEVDKGSLSDRKIFELAAVQSQREASQHKAVEARDKALARLNHALSERDGELAHAEKRIVEAESQVEELNRIHRREDVNMDYLKSIVVQFLSLAPGTSERAALLPVLATLLQFDANDYRMIEDGKSKVSWWGTVEPKTIGESTITSSSSTDYFTELTSYLKGAPSSVPTPNSTLPFAGTTARNV